MEAVCPGTVSSSTTPTTRGSGSQDQPERERQDGVWKRFMAGVKRRCQLKLERLVRVLFGRHRHVGVLGRGIQTVRSISLSGNGSAGEGGGGEDR